MANTRRVVNKEEKWFAWCGDGDDLRRIAYVAQRGVEQRQSTAQDASRTYLDARLFDGNEEIIGEPDAVLDELDLRSVARVEFVGQFPYNSKDELTIQFGAKFAYDGSIQLKVASSDSTWARSTFGQLADDIGKGVPWWAPLREKGHILGVWIVLCELFALAALLVLYPHISPDARSSIYVSLATLASVVALGLFMSGSLSDWLFPPLEITRPGGQSSGGRRRAVIGSVLISVAVGVFVNLIS